MGLTRITEEQLDKMRQEVQKLTSEIREDEAILKDQESPLWRRLAPQIREAIEANREKIEGILAAGPYRIEEATKTPMEVDPMADWGSLKALGGAIAFGKHILKAVEVGPAIERKRERLAKVKAEIQRASEEQGLQQGV